jgi:hypothetical protein
MIVVFKTWRSPSGVGPIPTLLVSRPSDIGS